MIINTNIQAQATANNLNASQLNLAKSLGRLSTGSKIIVPSDDMGGLAVSSRLNSRIRRLDSALTNVVNAVSFTQTQDGFLKTVDKAFSRMGELAILSQDTTKSNEDRALYNQEFQQLKDYVAQTAKQDFNGVSLFSGQSHDIMVDAEGTTFTMVGIKLDAEASYTNAVNSGTDSWTLTQDARKTSIPGFLTNEPLWKLDNGNYSKTDPGGGAVAVAAGTFLKELPVLEETTITTATAPALSIGGTASGGAAEDRQTFNIYNNEGTVTLTYTAYSVPDSFKIYYDGVAIFDSGYVSGTTTVTKPFGPGASTEIEIVVNEGSGLSGTAWNYTGSVTGGLADQLDSVTPHELSDGMSVKLSWPGVDPDASPALSKDTVYHVNKIDDTTFSLHTTQADALSDTNRIRISTANSGAITVTTSSTSGGEDLFTQVDAGAYVSSDIAASGEDPNATFVASGSIVATDQDLGAGGVNIATKNSSDYKDVNLKSIEGGKIALTMIKLAINKVASDRARLGATQSRLNSTNEWLTATKENLSAATSRIADVDVAMEATNYARYQILVASGTEMLKQANQLPQSALQLLR